MSDTVDKMVLPTPAEFLKQVQEYSAEHFPLSGEDGPHKALGAIVECLLERGEVISYERLVSEFHYIKADSAVRKQRDPDWQDNLLKEGE